MSKFMEKHSVSFLVSVPPGYAEYKGSGYQEHFDFGKMDYAGMRDMVLYVVSHRLRLELINRIDEVVVFYPLSNAHIMSIARIQL
ncbi:MAG: hypothetical protein ACSLEM_00285 [Candidatus Malihini olakiniferum]